MTGYGVGEAPLGEGRLTLEVRALNHRYVDVRVRLPVELSDYAFFTEQKARELLSRGRFDIGVRVDDAALPTPNLSIARARSIYLALQTLRDELAPGTELPVSAVTAIPELIQAPSTMQSEQIQSALVTALKAAVVHLNQMREQEGAALGRELGRRLELARGLRERIREQADRLVPLHRSRLQERVERLLKDSNVAIDHGRLELELALLADRADVTEELVRLDSHFDQIERLLASDELIGRRLDFLLQEVGREVNTVGAKSQDAELSHVVVEMKAEIERMREQVQNVE
ncbi:MAG TPA: YicC/YloC family endoribonuclease [Polyangiaceae bacterium]|nr:YicC/YloC family endoribonuclease [Polyangiaceae bacterium]